MRNSALAVLPFVVTVVTTCRPGVPDAAVFQVQEPTGVLKEENVDFSYDERGRVTTGDTSGVFLVVLREVTARHLDSLKAPDTVSDAIVVSRGAGTYRFSDWTSRCTEYITQDCITHAATPKIDVSVVGWLRLRAP